MRHRTRGVGGASGIAHAVNRRMGVGEYLDLLRAKADDAIDVNVVRRERIEVRLR